MIFSIPLTYTANFKPSSDSLNPSIFIIIASAMKPENASRNVIMRDPFKASEKLGNQKKMSSLWSKIEFFLLPQKPSRIDETSQTHETVRKEIRHLMDRIACEHLSMVSREKTRESQWHGRLTHKSNPSPRRAWESQFTDSAVSANMISKNSNRKLETQPSYHL